MKGGTMKRRFSLDIIYGIAVILVLCACLFLLFDRSGDEPVTVRIAVASDSLVENFNTNYYTRWLEEKSGYDIEFEYFTQGLEEEYLRALLEDEKGRIDAVFLPKDREVLSQNTFERYISEGRICDLREYATGESNFTAVCEQLGDEAGNYSFPRVNRGLKYQAPGILWINIHWLNRISLPIPKNEKELQTVLSAFDNDDPNGNGLDDEIPIIHFPKEYNNLDNRQVRELINSADDVVGGFIASNITDYIYPNDSEVVSRFVPVPEIVGISHESFGAVENGGFIPQSAPHKEEAFAIMDLMLSEEASVIATYGEEGVDYRAAQESELSPYGNPARITTIRYLTYTVQNSNFRGAGPSNLSQEMSDEVKWQGDGSYIEYLQARAVRLYGNK